MARMVKTSIVLFGVNIIKLQNNLSKKKIKIYLFYIPLFSIGYGNDVLKLKLFGFISLFKYRRKQFTTLPANIQKIMPNYLKFDKNTTIIYTDNNILDSKIKELSNIKINVKQIVDNNLIVSLTSFPERINKDAKYTLYSLLNQSVKPSKTILWLAESQFPNKEKDIPHDIINMKQNGLDIEWYKQDIKSYKKLIPTLLRYPDAIVVTADDDIYYPENWLENLYQSYLLQQDKKTVLCYKAVKHLLKRDDVSNEFFLDTNFTKNKTYIDYKYDNGSVFNIAFNGSGTIFPAHSFYKDVCDEKLFMELAPTSDDIFLHFMLLLNNIKVKVINRNNTLSDYCLNHDFRVNILRDTTRNNGYRLCYINDSGGDNLAMERLCSYYQKEIQALINNGEIK